jgi:hypothetical protein
MAISSTQITDYLFKKVGYSVAKTDTSTAKYPFNESIASPLLTPGRYVWQQDYYIPSVASAPTSNTVVNGSTIVAVYNTNTSAVVQATALSESVSQETWSTGITNWIPPSFGSGYQLKLYAGWPNASAATVANFTQLPVAGSGNNDSWFFDYQAGIVNFADTNVPTAAANVSNVVYAMGAVYTGTLGVTNYGNLAVGGISINGNTITGNISGISFASNIYVGNIFYSNGQPFVSSTYGNTQVLANLAANTAANIAVIGNIAATNFVGNGYYLTGLPAGYANSNVASYLLTNTGNIAAGNIFVQNTLYTNTIASNTGNVVTVTGTGAVGLPLGTTAQRPLGSTGYIRYNTDESSLEYYNGTQWSPITNVIVDQAITGDGNTKTFTLTQSATAIGLLVSINGVIQNPNTGSYSVTGNQITFAEAPLASDSVDIRFIASMTSVPGTISNDLTIYGNLTVSGNILANLGIYTYGNTQVAQYLAANPQTGTYSNVNVAAYLSANPSGGSTYSNTNVAAYLTTATIATTGNITAGNLIANQYGNSVGTTATYTGNVTAANLNVGTVNISSTTGNYNVLNISGAALGPYGTPQTWRFFTNDTALGSSGSWISFPDSSLQTTAYPGALTGGVQTFSITGNVTTGSYINAVTGNIVGNLTAGNVIGNQYGNSIGTTANYSGNVTAANVVATHYGNSVGTTASYTGNVSAAYFIGNIINSSGTTNLVGNVQTGNLTVTGNLVTTGYGFFPGAFQESSTAAGVFVGNTGSSGGQTPRIAFYNGNVTQNWQVDNFNGALRFFTPGVTRASIDGNTNQLQVYGNVSTTGQLISTMGTANTDNQLILQGNVYKGGVGYHDFLRVTSTYSSVTNPNKFFRLDSAGSLQIVNSAYNSTLFAMTDSGDTTIAGNLTVNGINSGYAPNRPAFRVVGSGGSIAATANVTSSNWSVDYNQGGYLNGSNGYFTAPVAGLYQVCLITRTSANNNSGIIQAVIQQNYTGGNRTVIMIEYGPNTSMNHTGGSTIVKMAAGDSLQMRVLQGTINFDGNDNWSVAYIG